HDQLGLFDTPPTPKQIRLSVAIVGVLMAMLALMSVVRDVPLGQIESFIPMVDSVTSLVDLIIATLLYVQAGVFRSRALTALASGYVFTALVLIPHALTFPGAFSPTGLLGAGLGTTAWIYICWRAALPISVILYVFFNRADVAAQPAKERRSPRIAEGVLVAVVLAVAVTLVGTIGQDMLPVLFVDRMRRDTANMFIVSCILMALFAVAVALLGRKRKSVLDIWLLVVLAAWVSQTLLLQSLGGRFTVNWYFSIAVVLLSHLFLMLALIAESSRLYARLALSTAARNREHDTRLMSMDAVAAAISHEVGQPLTAVTVNALAGLNWLTLAQPDLERAKESLRATLDAGRRSTDVIHSIRA
ncbi:MAG: two-component sensor histidine kinase, partial [Alphaproteobacteria bacterium]